MRRRPRRFRGVLVAGALAATTTGYAYRPLAPSGYGSAASWLASWGCRNCRASSSPPSW